MLTLKGASLRCKTLESKKGFFLEIPSCCLSHSGLLNNNLGYQTSLLAGQECNVHVISTSGRRIL